MGEPVTAEQLESLRADILRDVGVATNLQTELAREREARIAAETRATAAPAAPAKPQRSAEELQKAVDDGVISQLQANEIQLTQRHEADREALRAELSNEYQQQQRAATIQDQIAKYKDRHPAIMQDGSDDRARLSERYEELRKLGYVDDTSTELLALRETFGRLDAPKERTHENPPSHEGGAAPGGASASPGYERAEDGVFKDLEPRLIAHYRKGISTGIYSGEDDPTLLKELEFAKK